MEFYGFPRKDDTAGIRNYVGIISAMDNVNPLARKIVDNVYGTILITDLFGRKMAGTNHEMRVRALSGMGKNPNLGGVIVLSLHQASAMSLAEPMATSGKDIECIVFQEIGSSLKFVEEGIRTAVKGDSVCRDLNVLQALIGLLEKADRPETDNRNTYRPPGNHRAAFFAIGD